MENDPATGRIVWQADYTAKIDTVAGGTIWTATYTVDKNTPTGKYTVSFTGISVIDGSFDGANIGTLTATISVNNTYVPPHEHVYSTDWKTNDTDHWHECECGVKADIAKHTSTDDNVATLDKAAVCDVCGVTYGKPVTPKPEEPEVPVVPVIPTYTVTVPADIAGGTVTVSNTNPEQGEIITITATPDRNYKLTDVINGVSYGPISPINYVVYGDLSITATFAYEPSFIEGAGSDTSKPSMYDKVLGLAGAFPNYTDVLPTDWFYNNVLWAWSRNILDKGVTFAPNTNATRATIVEWIWRMEGRPVVYGVAFDDTTAMSAAWAASAGIVNGYGNGKFGPDDLVTREQLAAILYRYANYKGINTNARGDLSKFSDAAKISDYAVEPMQWAVAVGMINGYPNGTVAPQGNATRAELTALLNRMSVWYGI